MERRKQNAQDGRHLLPPSEYWNTKPYEEDEDSGAEDIMYKLLPRGPRIRNEEVVYTKDFSILIAVWVIFLVLHIVKTYTSTCSTTYWILNLLQVLVAVGVSAYKAV